MNADLPTKELLATKLVTPYRESPDGDNSAFRKISIRAGGMPITKMTCALAPWFEEANILTSEFTFIVMNMAS